MLAHMQALRAAAFITAATGVVIPALAITSIAGQPPNRAGPPGRPGPAGSAVRPVRFAGYTFEVPRSWPVISLARHRRACVRFDRHAAYLGTPGPDESCPAALIGATEALLIEPASAGSARWSAENPVARQITVRAPRIAITATFSSDQAQIDQILRSASLPRPVIRQPNPAGALSAPARAGSRQHRLPLLPAWVTNYRGFGFDNCAIPNGSAMRAWRRHSHYRAVGVFIGGSDLACAQTNLSRSWLRHQAYAGWHFMPLYVGPQASFGQLSRPGREGTAAAADAVAQARRLGFGIHTPLYYDMEGYPPGEGTAALRFFSAWTVRVHQLGYASGIYSSALSGIGDLARYYWCRIYAMPNVIYFGRWDGDPTTRDPVIRHGEWPYHRRLHQFAGNIRQTFGGVTLLVDQDYLNIDLRYPRHRGQAEPGPIAPQRHRGCARR